MNPEARAPLTPVVNRVILDLGRFLQEFFRWQVGGVLAANAKTWRAAARESLHGKRIYQALQTERNSPVGVRVEELIALNAKLIRSLPETLNARAQAYIAREQLRGARAATMAKNVQAKWPQLAQSQAKLLARTEVGRAETALTQARAERLGLNWYEWATSEDQRVRASHRLLDKGLVKWNHPPSPEALAHAPGRFGRYHPGTVFNCRCLALPLVSLDEVRWPHRVYAGGRIEVVGRTQFENWIKVPSAA